MPTLLKSTELEVLPIPAGLIFFWAGTAASIPTSWQAESALVGNIYLRGNNAGVDPGGTGGSTTHSHTVDHAGGSTGGPSNTHGTDGGGDAAPRGDHTHTIPSTSGLSSDAPANSPLYLDVLPVKTSLTAGSAGRTRARVADLGATCLLPARMIGCWLGTLASIPTGWSLCDGNTVNTYVTPNLVTFYSRGVASTGTAPGTLAGTDNHAHQDSHSHSTSSSGINGSGGGYPNGTTITIADPHTHTTPTHAYTTGAGSNDPSHKKVAWVMFTGYGASGAVNLGTGRVTSSELDPTLVMPRGMMASFYNTSVLTAPSGYAHADGGSWTNGTPTGHAGTRPNMAGRMLRGVASTGTNAGGTGGTTTHTHSGGLHGHGTSGVNATQGSFNTGGAGPIYTDATHQHAFNNVNVALDSWTTLPVARAMQFMVRD